LYELISSKILIELSKVLKTEIIRFTNSDTAQMAGILVCKNGEIIRREEYEEEEDKNAIGERTKYEIGSIISNFEKLREAMLIPLEKEIHFNLYKEIENKQ
jgi:hypothetical protein